MIKRTLSLIFLCIIPFIGFAGERGGFLGAGASWTLTQEAFIDQSDLGFKLFGGYNLNNFIAFEVAYNDLGELIEDIRQEGPDPLLIGVSSKAYTGSTMILFPPSDRFKLFMKLGIYYHEDTLTFTALSNTTEVTDENWDLFGGIGTEFIISEHTALRGEWERFKAGSADIDCVSISFCYTL